ncbi:UbiA family prenyltransferase [Catenovulum sediminis]|uniref:UbiA family prenyltransferase n=1 Tax=Catenovulum sediminis TaxID=1740262 RepID=UPI00163DE28C|nr:UbiA family prenyltransferase [Catenovulum sediminis]
MKATTKAYLQLIRAPNGISAISNILAAAVIVSAGQIDFSLVFLIFASLFLYYAGMALNDCLDYREDLQERAFRPLPSGQIKLRHAWILVVCATLIGLASSWAFSPQSYTSLYVAGALLLAIIIYDGVIKGGFLGALCMGACRYFNWLLGASFIGVLSLQTSVMPFLVAIPIFVYITALTFLSKQETQADNKKVLFVVSALLLTGCGFMFYLALVVFELTATQQITSLLLLISCFITVLWRLYQLWQAYTPTNIQNMIQWMLIAVIPLDAMMVALSGQYIWSLIILTLLVPCRLLSKRLYMT